MGWLKFWKKDSAEKRLAIIDAGDNDFNQQVIQRSYKTTVVVDFWAAWCGPCRQLGPVLEKVAEEPTSDFILVKLNTEHNQKAAARFNIYSIPAVKAFKNGQMVDEFTGALPEVLVRRFLKKVSTAPAPAPRVRGSDDAITRLRQAEQHLKRGRGFEAFVLLNEFPESPQKERADALLPLARFLFDMGDGDGLTGIDDLDEHYMSAAKALRKRKASLALENLLDSLDLGEEVDRSYTLEVIESLFSLLGEKSKIVVKYRQQLVAADA